MSYLPPKLSAKVKPLKARANSHFTKHSGLTRILLRFIEFQLVHVVHNQFTCVSISYLFVSNLVVLIT